MFRAVALAVSAAVVSAGPGAGSKALEGTWAIESAVLAGRDHTADFKGFKLTVAAGRYTVAAGENTDKGTLTLFPTRSPKAIDVKSESGPFQGKTLPGIYELKSDRLTICLDADGKVRPTAFEAKEGTKAMLMTYRREKK